MISQQQQAAGRGIRPLVLATIRKGGEQGGGASLDACKPGITARGLLLEVRSMCSVKKSKSRRVLLCMRNGKPFEVRLPSGCVVIGERVQTEVRKLARRAASR